MATKLQKSLIKRATIYAGHDGNDVLADKFGIAYQNGLSFRNAKLDGLKYIPKVGTADDINNDTKAYVDYVKDDVNKRGGRNVEETGMSHKQRLGAIRSALGMSAG